jgi:imidazolonepropionase-like amidohydrolase
MILERAGRDAHRVSIRAIRCGTLFDGIAPAPIRDAMVVVDGGRITAVGPADRHAGAAGSELLDLTIGS